jgi:hypothetical protein
MDQLHEQVARAWRRLVLEQFLARSVWCLFAALAVAAVAIAVPRVVAIDSLAAQWDAIWFLSAVGGGLLAAAVWTMFSRRTALDAAIEIDRRFDLRERVASSLSLSEADRQSDAGRALVDDAIRAASRLDVGEKFEVGLSRRAWLPLVPAALVFVLVMFFDPRVATSSVQPATSAEIQKQIREATESARKKLEEQRKQAEKKGLKAAGDLFKQIEQGTRELSENRDLDRTKAAVKLNDLAKQLEERRKQLGGNEAMQKQLQNMKNLGAGPGDKIAQAMKKGDWKQALDEVDKLAKDLREGKLDAKDKQQLAKQLQQMKDKLEAAAEAHQQAMDDLKRQIDQAQQQGDLAKAGKLQEMLDKLAQQMPQMEAMQQMAQRMGAAQQALQQGDPQQAAAAMAEMAQQMAQMQQQMNELEMLDAAMNQLDMAKNAMACENCAGEGCAMCQGDFANMGLGNMDFDNMDVPPGMGMRQGRGSGPRPDERNATNRRDSRVKQKLGRGAATFGGMVEGPNVKGDVAESIKEEMASLTTAPADPVADERLPRSRREHAGEYFNLLREGR